MKRGNKPLIHRGYQQILFGIGVGFLTLLAITGLAARIIDKGILEQKYENILASIALLAGSFLGGVSCGGGEGKLVRSALTGAGILLGLLALNIVFYGGSLVGLVPGAVVVSGGCVASNLLGLKVKRKRKTAYRKKRNR